MNKPNVAKLFKHAQLVVSKHSPEILTGLGIAGMITTTVLAVRATPKAMQLIEEEKEELQVDELTVVETVKAAWKPYIPAVVLGTVSTACLIGASSVSAKRNAALATAYKLSETALSEYREKVIETLGEKKEKGIRDKVNEERIKKNPPSKSEVIITSKGDTLCYDVMSGRFFTSDIEKIRRAINEINRVMLLEMYVSLNDLYDELDLDHTDVGDILGWHIDDKLIELEPSSHLTEDGRPCLAMGFTVPPHHGFDRLM